MLPVFKKYFLLVNVLTFIFILCLVLFNITKRLSISDDEDIKISTQKQRYIVHTSSCMIPYFAPFHERKYFHVAKRKTCGNKNLDFSRQEDNKLFLDEKGLRRFCNGRSFYCEYQTIIRKSDKHFLYSSSTKIKGNATIENEFIRVKCFCEKQSKVYTNFHAFIIPSKNSTNLLESRKNEKKPVSKHLNIVMIGLDSVSRLNSHRQLSATRKFLMESLNAVELFGYNKIADNTFFNVLALLFNHYHYEIGWTLHSKKRFDEYENILKKARSRGYKTMYVEDASDMHAFSSNRQGFKNKPTDHYFFPMSSAIRKEKHILSGDKKCLKGRLYFRVLLDYIKDFLKTYKSNPGFVFNFNSYITHNSLNSAGAVDSAFRDYLKELNKENLLEDVMLFIFSDHGIRQGAFRETLQGKFEERLPMMYIAPPKWFPEKYPLFYANLKANSKMLTTPFDIHATLLAAINFDEFQRNIPKVNVSSRSIPLFLKIPQNRTCKDASLKSHWCTCQKSFNLPVSNKKIIKIAELITSYINKLLHPEKEKCVPLKLKTVHHASSIVATEQMMMHRSCKSHYKLETCKLKPKSMAQHVYQLNIQTSPGSATFEATVEYNSISKKIRTLGMISRTNLYGNQSICISNPVLKMYCFCK